MQAMELEHVQALEQIDMADKRDINAIDMKVAQLQVNITIAGHDH